MEISVLLHAMLRILLGALLPVLPAHAQTFGSGQLRIISPYPPGGGTDTLGRIIAQRYTERFGQPAIVENRPGANGTIGAAFVAKAAGDGLTVLIVPAGYAANPSLYKVIEATSAEQFAEFLKKEAAKYLRVIEAAGIRGTL